ncbi:MAG TPA: hypothetical protein VN282_09640 [Pyrinomonadaceae bacterium]|nr:hypothetical protein [Pyrinomonadaceae bacterium]
MRHEDIELLLRRVIAEQKRAARYEGAVILLYAAGLFAVLFLASRSSLGAGWLAATAGLMSAPLPYLITRFAARRARLESLRHAAEVSRSLEGASGAEFEATIKVLQKFIGPHGPGDIP